jgi:methylated-DNA-[protein]-cysteine S-methyltransferase
MNCFCTIDSPLGPMLLTSDAHSLTGVYFVGQKYQAQPEEDWIEDAHLPILQQTRRQLDEYFARRRSRFDLKLAPCGTPFQQRVWAELNRIGAGETLAYGELARRLGADNAVRAVAAAVGRNPISIVIPCHRVIGADGALTGYAGGLERKHALLALESACLPARQFAQAAMPF